MGYYVNPPKGSKGAWLEENSAVVSTKPLGNFQSYRDAGCIPVCHVDNIAFSAAGVCYSEAEFLEWKTPDGRHKEWYSVREQALYDLLGPSLQKAVEESK